MDYIKYLSEFVRDRMIDADYRVICFEEGLLIVRPPGLKNDSEDVMIDIQKMYGK